MINSYATPVANFAFAGVLVGGALIWAVAGVLSNDARDRGSGKSRFRILRVSPPAPDTQAVDALRQRLSKVEHCIAHSLPG